MRTVNIYTALEPTSTGRGHNKERERPQEESVRVEYPSDWTYEQKCLADEKRINSIRP